MEVGHGGSRSCATLESHRDRDAGRPGRAQDDPGRDTERGRARARPWNTFCGEEARKGCQRGSGGWARRGLANGLGGSFQPAEGLRVRCRKEGVTLETGPPRDVAVLTPSIKTKEKDNNFKSCISMHRKFYQDKSSTIGHEHE